MELLVIEHPLHFFFELRQLAVLALIIPCSANLLDEIQSFLCTRNLFAGFDIFVGFGLVQQVRYLNPSRLGSDSIA